MDNAQEPGRRESRARRILVGAAALALIGLVLGLFYFTAAPIRTGRDLALISLCLLLASGIVSSIRDGWTYAPNLRRDPQAKFVRSAEPVRFWATLVISSAVVVALLVGALGDLLRRWDLWTEMLWVWNYLRT